MQTEQNNEGQPLISFIIPLYNVPFDMLRDCVKSILKLSLSVDERQIIVVDDGSEQSPVQMLTELDDGIIYIRQKNRGVSAARNTGLRMAEGQYIQFVDADDILLQAPYEHVLDLVRYDGSDIVMFDFCERPPKSLKYSDFEPATGSEWLRRNNIHGSAWGYVFRSSILGSLRFTPGISYGEDEEFTPQLLLRADRVRVTTAQAYLYSTRPASAINRRDMRSRLKRLNDAKHVILSLRAKATTMPPEESIAIQRRTAQLTMDYIYNVIVITRSRRYLDKQLDELRKKGLFPLPDRNYTTKYTWFRRMTNTSIGLTILLRTLPLLRNS
jgi:glycosyltransferase involved in cell wall biosynthesis